MANLKDIDVTPLLDAGFEALTEAEFKAEVARLAELGMDQGGTYDYGYELKRGDVTIFIEQNTSTLVAGGLETMTKHPAVAAIQGPKGRVNAPAEDVDLILALVDEVS